MQLAVTTSVAFVVGYTIGKLYDGWNTTTTTRKVVCPGPSVSEMALNRVLAWVDDTEIDELTTALRAGLDSAKTFQFRSAKTLNRFNGRYGFEGFELRLYRWNDEPSYQQVVDHVDYFLPSDQSHADCPVQIQSVVFDRNGRFTNFTSWNCWESITGLVRYSCIDRLTMQRIARRFRTKARLRKHADAYLIPELLDIAVAYV